MALRTTLETICDLAIREQVDAVLCAGDLYEHDRFTPDTVAFVAEVFNRVEVPVLLAPGNHDWLGPQSLYATAVFGPHVHVFRDARLSPCELTEGFTVWGAAHRAPANTAGFLDGFGVERDGVNIGLFHGSEQGSMGWQEAGKVPHAPFRAEQVERSGLHHAFVGHFHTPRHETTYTYPGNPDPLTFGETGRRGAVIATVGGDGTVTHAVHDVSQTLLADITVDVSGAEHSGQIRDLIENALDGRTGIVRLTINGELPPDVDFRIADIAHLGSHVEALVPRVGNLRIAHDLTRLRDEPTVRGTFVRMVQDDPDLCDEERERILTTGLRALAGRDDLEA